LIPQGVTPARGKSSFFFKVLMILTVHVVVIGGMLLQGCKDTKDSSATPSSDTTTANSADTMPPATTPNAVSNATPAVTTPTPALGQPMAQPPVQPGQPTLQPAPAPGTIGGVQPAPAPVPPQVLTTPTPVTAPTTDMGAKEYVIASGDTLGAIAKKNGVSLKALLEANAGVNPKKLQVGQKIQIPAGSAGAVAGAGTPGATSADVASGDATVYTVKSGDTLGKIAKANHTTYKKIMAANDLKTTSIKIGQKLKIPAAKSASTETAAPVPMPTVPAQPVLPPPTTPAPTTGTTASNQ
jgi:LysM repeat protein